jgi:tRNA-2-methylthio-N6-dimethylallyladenosine synthase
MPDALTMAHLTHPADPYPVCVTAAGRTYQIRTYGCQMNAHDSERLAGLLDEAGYQPAREDQTPDVIVFNTCAVRENAAGRLYGNLGHLLPQKRSGMQIAVGGCLAQMERTKITQRAPWVDVVYGTHNMASLPALLERARVRNEAQVEFAETLETFPSLLPARRQSAYSAWVSISVGCNNTCTFCIVPSLRGKERDRRPGDILAEIGALVADGVLEVTLLGQNVNSYGAEFGDRKAFGKLLRSCGEIDGLERVRFTSPHPRDFTDDVVDAMAQTPNVMPSLHMPLQSGSDTVLKAMRRAYRRDRYLAILDRVRASIPDAAITTDIIVGFPGETDQDFEDTLDLVRRARFAGAFTFRYSIRPGTPAATMDGQVPASVVQERYERLAALVEETTFAENRKLTGATVEVLVAEGEGRKDAATHRMSGRARDNRLVHFAPHETSPRPGDVVTVTITRAAPHYLLSDAAPLSLRRTRAGDAWEAATAAPAPVPAMAAPVLLGMPAPGPSARLARYQVTSAPPGTRPDAVPARP